jgi:hypothetical protein
LTASAGEVTNQQTEPPLAKSALSLEAAGSLLEQIAWRQDPNSIPSGGDRVLASKQKTPLDGIQRGFDS